jgi:hypothetical protein
VALTVGQETTRVHEEGGGEERDMNYLRSPHSPCYGILREVRISQTKKTDESGYQRILASGGFRGRRVLPLEDVLTTARGRGDER